MRTMACLRRPVARVAFWASVTTATCWSSVCFFEVLLCPTGPTRLPDHGRPEFCVRTGLLCDLVDLVGHRLLRLVRVRRARVDLQFAGHLPAETGVGQHALDRLLD